MSVYWDFLSAVRDQLREQLTFAGYGTSAGIKPEHIVIRHMPLKVDDKSTWMDEETPGIIVSPARIIRRDGGNNSHDWLQYPVLIQIIDHCEEKNDEAKLRSWMEWEEQIGKYLHHRNVRRVVWGTPGYLFHTWVETTDVLEEQKYDFHRYMVMALQITGQSENPRNAAGAQ